MAHTIYLSLGTNIGDRQANLRTALAALPPAVRLVAVSSIYETAPWGYLEQPDFLNLAVKAETKLSPQDLLAHLKSIEEELGREKTVRWGPRRIDLDILFYDKLVLEMDGLTIPHPKIAERAFVLVPLAELAPGLKHPVTGETVREMLAAVDKASVKEYQDNSYAS